MLSRAHQHAAAERLRRACRSRSTRAGCRRTGSSGRSSAGARAVICTPRAQNPTGASVTAERADGAARRPGAPPARAGHRGRPLLGALGAPPTTGSRRPRCRAGRSCGRSPSSSGPTCALALVAADEDTADRLHARLGPATTWVSHLLQHAVAGMLADPRIEQLRQTARSAYAERAALLVERWRARPRSPPTG